MSAQPCASGVVLLFEDRIEAVGCRLMAAVDLWFDGRSRSLVFLVKLKAMVYNNPVWRVLCKRY